MTSDLEAVATEQSGLSVTTFSSFFLFFFYTGRFMFSSQDA